MNQPYQSTTRRVVACDGIGSEDLSFRRTSKARFAETTVLPRCDLPVTVAQHAQAIWRSQIIRLLLMLSMALVVAGGMSPARAEIWCVSTPGELLAALASAADSVESTEIRVRTGTYFLTTRLNYNSASSLQVSGGWQGSPGNCSSRITAPGQTRLFAAIANTAVMRVQLPTAGATSVTLTGLEFTAGESTMFGVSACLTVRAEANSNATVRINGNVFSGCRSENLSGAALFVDAASASVSVTNNLFFSNTGSGIVLFNLNGSTTVEYNNNTLSKSFTSALPSTALNISANGSNTIRLVNNVLWGNAHTRDIEAFGSPISMGYNLIETVGSIPPGSVNVATLSRDPGFVDAINANFRPRADSPLRNSGGIPSVQLNVDLDGNSRVLGVRMDRGAYEFQELFSSGFE
ncbi:MAG: right-handed parallel beta-helix repeat-containing protein [Rhodanobacteraceae bacterium]|nr:right-handed parallel beta-helix repeat-containing protein [Rhodanobacteraceae bacterium]